MSLLQRAGSAAALLARRAGGQGRRAPPSKLALAEAPQEPALAALFHHSSSPRGSWWGPSFSSSSAGGPQQQAQGGGASDAEARAESSAEAGASDRQQQQQGEAAGGGDLSPEELQAALQDAQQQLEAESKKAEELRERLLRTLADMENLRERTARQAAEARQFATQGLVRAIIDVADNLERAAGSVPEADVANDEGSVDAERALGLLRSLRDGVLMTDSLLMKVLAREGVTRYDPAGQPFDPNLHAALFEVPDATRAPGTVAVVVKKGYLLHDRAVRAAEVGVVRAPPEEED